MTQGVEVFDASGNLVFSATDRLGRVLGITTISSNGSLTDSKLLLGANWATCMTWNSVNDNVPVVTLSGNVISWAYTGSAHGNPPVTASIIYGLY